MVWQDLKEEAQLTTIQEASFVKPQLIFKHSTRCPISTTAKSRFERTYQAEYGEKIDFHLLDLITFRALSREIAEKWQVTHESPQVLFIQEGKVSYHESHYGIAWEGILSAVS